MTRSVPAVDQENVSATLTIAVPAATAFAVLADPTSHAAIDGTGWRPGYRNNDGDLEFGGWTWRYDLAQARTPGG
jgi:hypothetical protein